MTKKILYAQLTREKRVFTCQLSNNFVKNVSFIILKDNITVEWKLHMPLLKKNKKK